MRRIAVFLTVFLAVLTFCAAALVYSRSSASRQAETVAQNTSALVRPHSPVIGRPDAPVTIVEFFDPSCEACRAFHPVVKAIMERHPNDLRLVLRYAPFHEGSDEAVGILEAARLQGLFEPSLEALLEAQPEWAVHGQPQLAKAWAAAAKAGLNVELAREAAKGTAIANAIKQDVADLKALGVNRTPTFFVNERPLTTFGAQELYDLVLSELDRSK